MSGQQPNSVSRQLSTITTVTSVVDDVDSDKDITSVSVVFDDGVLVDSVSAAVVVFSGHPSLSGPVASVSSSSQQPNSEALQGGGGGGHPSWSLP